MCLNGAIIPVGTSCLTSTREAAGNELFKTSIVSFYEKGLNGVMTLLAYTFTVWLHTKPSALSQWRDIIPHRYKLYL